MDFDKFSLKVTAISVQIKSVLYGMLVRTIKNDNLWMSGASGIGREGNGVGAHIAIHFSWQANVTALEQVLPKVIYPFLYFLLFCILRLTKHCCHSLLDHIWENFLQ